MSIASAADDGTVPRIETERLRLRAHRASDHAPCLAIWSDPVMVRHIGGITFTAEEVWKRLLQYRGLWGLLGYGYWAVEEKASGRYIGDVGFADLAREIEPSLRGMLEGGWVLAPQVHGRGYATEAVLAACTWLDAHWPGEHAVCIIAPENPASVRVAEKAGFAPWLQTTYRDEPAHLFRR